MKRLALLVALALAACHAPQPHSSDEAILREIQERRAKQARLDRAGRCDRVPRCAETKNATR